jgi:hypothetical protein
MVLTSDAMQEPEENIILESRGTWGIIRERQRELLSTLNSMQNRHD